MNNVDNLPYQIIIILLSLYIYLLPIHITLPLILLLSGTISFVVSYKSLVI